MKIVYRDKVWELKGNITLRDALKKIGLSPETVLATREGKLLTDDVILRSDDVIKLIAVVSEASIVAAAGRASLGLDGLMGEGHEVYTKCGTASP